MLHTACSGAILLELQDEGGHTLTSAGLCLGNIYTWQEVLCIYSASHRHWLLPRQFLLLADGVLYLLRLCWSPAAFQVQGGSYYHPSYHLRVDRSTAV